MNRFLASAYAAVGSLAILGASPANAGALDGYTYHPGDGRGHIDGYIVSEIWESPSYDAPDLISIYGPYGVEDIMVTCSPFYWVSEGPNSASFSEQIAREWCF